ncbi:DUF998 domain-containing protein [Amycolatopsis pigmentata]|uniref:DUF998 domain-containing protein n=1 Tax=Amycolatopsis pigmentata TaxID=450801 RepID=A0ABW5FRN0_9PSEU
MDNDIAKTDESDQTDKAARRNKVMRRWARFAVVANVIFSLCWLLAAVWQGPAYSSVAHTISDMYAVGAPGAAFLIVFFTLCGAVVMWFAYRSLWPSLREAGWPAKVGVILVAVSIFGLGDLLSLFEQEGCRLADAGCTTELQTANFGGATDATLSTLGVFALMIGGFFLYMAMNRLPEWKSWARPALYVTIAFLVIFLLDGVLGGAGVGGLLERAIALSGAAALSALAIGVLRRTKKAAVPAKAAA